MELNWILIWICGISSAVNLVTALQNRRSPAWGWRAVLTALLLLLTLLLIVVPYYAGFIIGPIWFMFALLPGMLIRRIHRLLAERKYRRAYWAARLAGWLHPCDGWPQQTQLVQALALYERGQNQQASALIERLSRKPSSLGFSARLIQAQQSGDWQGLLNEIDRRFLPTTVVRDETLFLARAQALGELGRPVEMIRMMADVVTDRAGLSTLSRDILLMRVAALSGQVQATERQLHVLARTYAPDVLEFWRLTAQQVAGRNSVREGFGRLQKTAGPFLQPMIARRVSRPLPAFDLATADDDVRSILGAVKDRIRDEAPFSDWIEDDHSKPWATWAIAAALVAVFVVEMAGGSATPSFSGNYLMSLIRRTQDSIHLIDLGALIVPQSGTPGEWWRVLTAGFLHFGPLHLGMNLFGLLVLAPRLERSWGRLPMIVCYLITTIASMALAPHVMVVPEHEQRILVGASGGIMGLLGGLVGDFFVGWLRDRNRHTRRPLVFLLLIIALQTTFDLMTPNVSFACHAMGLATGIAFGTGWTWLSKRQKEVA